MENTTIDRHSEIRKYIKANNAFVPCAIFDEIRPELDLGLLFYVKLAIVHLRSHVQIAYRSVKDSELEGSYLGLENITDPTYSVQQAAVDHALFSIFAITQHPLLNAPVFPKVKRYAEARLAEEKRGYDNEHGKGASDNLVLFGITAYFLLELTTKL